jgi:hypothetical protein
MKLPDHPLLDNLRSLGLPSRDFVVFGSGPLLAHRLINDVPDLDVLARGEAWRQAQRLAVPERAPSGVGKVIRAPGNIEIFDAWPLQGESWNVDRLIDDAEIIEGVRFVPLKTVLRWKEGAGRQKDEDDIAILRKCLGLD